MIEIKPFDAALWPPEILREAREDFNGVTDEWLNYQSLVTQSGWAFMAVDELKPLAAAGAWLVWPGVAQVWAIVLKQTPEVMAILLKKLKRILPEFCRIHQIRRIQAVIDPTEDNKKLVGYLEMKIEGILHGYGVDGGHWLLYGRNVNVFYDTRDCDCRN
jgi:hypothetical protein